MHIVAEARANDGLYVLGGHAVLPHNLYKCSICRALNMGCTGQIHRRYVAEMEAAEAADGRGWDVLFYGDSIMEEWR